MCNIGMYVKRKSTIMNYCQAYSCVGTFVCYYTSIHRYLVVEYSCGNEKPLQHENHELEI